MATAIALRTLEHRVKITVTITTELKIRLWIAKQLLRLAARVIRAEIEIKERGA